MPETRVAPEAHTRTAAPVRVVVNANASGAGTGAAPEEIASFLRRESAEVDLRRTRSLADLADVYRHDDGRRLVLVGGDGTVHAAANMAGPRRDVAVVPAGRANNIARSLGIPTDWQEAAQLALHGQVRPIDLIEARSASVRQLVVESVSVGFLAEARVRYHGRNSADVVAGLRAGTAALAYFHPLAVRISGPTGTEALHLAQLFVANLPLYEFGLHAAPQADPVDRTLDLVGIEARSRRDVLRMLLDLRRGTHLDRPNIHAWRAERAVIETHGYTPIVADSTDFGPGPVELRVAPAALRIVRP